MAGRLNLLSPSSAIGVTADATVTADIEQLIAAAEQAFGPVDLYFANAGMWGEPGLEASDDDWDSALQLNLLAHVRAARLLVPGWLERGSGYFLSNASASGLLTQVGNATYAVSKHAAVGFAEWLSITYGHRGLVVSCLCSMSVNTDLITALSKSSNPMEQQAARVAIEDGGLMEPLDVADHVMSAIAAEQFLILPHSDVMLFWRRKVEDYERWLEGMRRYQDVMH
jgi:NAD(P)-dependent dehydrogenase (short-subunit alcohol dehydrogenase family)